MLSFGSTLMLTRFMRSGVETTVDQSQSLLLAKQLSLKWQQGQPVSAQTVLNINPPLGSVLAVFHLQLGVAIHACVVVDKEPTTLVALTDMLNPGVQIVDMQKLLLDEARRGFRTSLFQPKQIAKIDREIILPRFN